MRGRVGLVLAGAEAPHPMGVIWDLLAALVDPLAALLARERGDPDAESHDRGESDAGARY